MGLFERQLARRGVDIEITDRDVKILNGQPQEIFSNPVNIKVLVNTVRGVKVFDSTNTERVATHKICMNFIADITSEKWIKFPNNKRIKILTVENVCEQDKRLILMCTERGDDSKVVNDA